MRKLWHFLFWMNITTVVAGGLLLFRGGLEGVPIWLTALLPMLALYVAIAMHRILARGA